jgi:hypothetical protein
MAVDIEPPAPPDVTNRQVPEGLDAVDVHLEDLRRGEIETALRDGAWQEGFEEWAEYADVAATSLEMAVDRALFQAFDFYYAPDGEQVRAVPPTPPEDWVAEADRSTVSELRTALDDLGETVAELLSRDYLDWAEAADGDYVWREETFSTVEDER